jgi:nitroreductase
MTDPGAVMRCILSRRSVRRFTDEAVPEDVLREVVRAACAGPRGGGLSLTRYVAVTNPGTIAAMRAAVEAGVAALREHVKSGRAQERFDGYASHFALFGGAPAVVAVLARPYDSIYARIVSKYVPEGELPAQDLVEISSMTAAAAVENMLLAAHALGYGACFMTGPTIAQEALGVALGVEEPWRVVALVPVGKPAEPPAPKTEPALDEMLTFDR